jgi:hypothetical protein
MFGLFDYSIKLVDNVHLGLTWGVRVVDSNTTNTDALLRGQDFDFPRDPLPRLSERPGQTCRPVEAMQYFGDTDLSKAEIEDRGIDPNLHQRSNAKVTDMSNS